MGLLAPWFLAGAAAAALPIYLHLLRRHRADPRPFSSLMFFERRTQSSIKHRRLRYLLLLSLRLALLLLLALAFADPFINRPTADAASEKLVLLVIDNSFSMRAGTRMGEARREAVSLLSSRRPSDRAEVMALGSQVQVLTQPTQDSNVLRAAVESIQPGDSRASFGDLARAVRAVVQSTQVPIELHLFSDMQKSAMPASMAEMAFPPNVSLVLHPVAKAAEPNWTIESLDVPGQVWEAKKASVRAVVAGYHTPAANRTMSLLVNGKTVATHTVQVPAGGRAPVEFQSLDVPYGFSRCELRLDSADSLPADDVSLFAVNRADPERVLFVHEAGDTRSPLYFGTALAAAGESTFKLESVTTTEVAGIQPSMYAFVVLSDVLSLPASFEDALAKYVGRGGGVLVAAGTSTAHAARVPLFGGTAAGPNAYSRDGQGFLTVGEADPSNPAIGKADRWSGVKFYFAARVDPAGSRVVARLTDQTPVLLQKSIGEGRAVLFASGLDNLTNDFPLHPAFVPFVEQTARYLSGLERLDGARVVDSSVELRTGKQTGASVEIVDPDGQRPLSLEDAASAQSFQLRRAGFYELHLADGRREIIGVNPDRRESDLDVMPDDVLSLWRGSRNAGSEPASGGAHAQQQSRPYGLWWYILLLVLAAAVAESLLASQYLERLREEA